MNKLWIKTFYNKLIEAESKGCDEEINMCLEYKNQHLPRFIYKYRNCNKYAYNDLFNNYMHLSFPTVFNDPFDCSSFCTHEQIILLSLIKKEYREYYRKDNVNKLLNISTKPFWNDEYIEYVKSELLKGKSYKTILINKIQKIGTYSKLEAQNYYKRIKQQIDSKVIELSEAYKKKVLLCSFSATFKNNLMWSHYANSHSGFCIEYDLEKIGKGADFSKALYPVIYSKKPLLSNIQACFYSEAIKDMLTVMNKSSDWGYEEEYRLFCPPELNQNYSMPILPSRIFLGLNIADKDKEKIIKLAKKHHIKVNKMEINASSFNLSSKPIHLNLF